MRRLRDQRGETGLMELLVASVVMIVVLGAVLLVFETVTRVDRETVARNEAQDGARTALDRLSRQLRNLASPTPDQPQAVDRATPYDVIFQSVDPEGPNAGTNAVNVRRIRWCLPAGGTRLYQQTQTWTTATAEPVPASTACPAPTGAATWDDARVAAEDVVNRHAGQDRPLFSFDSATATEISALHAELVVDREPGKGAAETRLSTGVFLRNQNRRPDAAFTATPSAQGIVLNGSLSADPEGQSLEFEWWEGGVKRGEDVVHTLPSTSGTSRTITLVVKDPAGLIGESTQTVTT